MNTPGQTRLTDCRHKLPFLPLAVITVQRSAYGPRGPTNRREGAAVRSTQRYLIFGLAAALMPVGVVTVASPASADCNSSGYATVCAQGEVRGGSSAPVAGPVYPSYCADPWYC